MLFEINNFILQASLREIYVNHGGCAKTAEYFYKFFKKIKDVDIVGIKVLNPKSRSDNSTNIQSKSKDEYMLDYFHVVLLVKYKSIVYAVDGAYGVKEANTFPAFYNDDLSYERGYLGIKALKKLNKNRSMWNDTFCDDRHHTLRQFFKNLNKEFIH